jgi:hypothetical protein
MNRNHLTPALSPGEPAEREKYSAPLVGKSDSLFKFTRFFDRL